MGLTLEVDAHSVGGNHHIVGLDEEAQLAFADREGLVDAQGAEGLFEGGLKVDEGGIDLVIDRIFERSLHEVENGDASLGQYIIDIAGKAVLHLDIRTLEGPGPRLF